MDFCATPCICPFPFVVLSTGRRWPGKASAAVLPGSLAWGGVSLAACRGGATQRHGILCPALHLLFLHLLLFAMLSTSRCWPGMASRGLLPGSLGWGGMSLAACLGGAVQRHGILCPALHLLLPVRQAEYRIMAADPAPYPATPRQLRRTSPPPRPRANQRYKAGSTASWLTRRHGCL